MIKLLWLIIVKRFKKAHADWREWKFIEDTFGQPEFYITTINKVVIEGTRTRLGKHLAMNNKETFIRHFCCYYLPTYLEKEVCEEDYLAYFNLYNVFQLK